MSMVNPEPALEFAKLIGAKEFVMKGDCGRLARGCEATTRKRAFRDAN